MKAKITFLIITIMALSVSAQKRTIDVSDFSELSLGIPGVLYLTQGSDEKVEIDCSDSAFEKIEFADHFYSGALTKLEAVISDAI